MSTAIAVSDAPTSLAISPNLDALLEHDERIRQLTTVEVPIAGGELSAPWSAVSMVEEVIHNSLPPPPRRRRPATAPNSPAYHKDTSQWLTMSPSAQNTIRTFTRSPAASISSTSDNNPFINPAPSLEDLKRLRRPRPSPSSSLAGASTGSSSVEARADSPSTPRPPSRIRAFPTTRASPTTPRTPTHVPTSSLPEKLVPKRRAGSGAGDSCTWRQSGHRKTESEPVQGLNTTIQTPLKLRERARLKGKLLKLKGTGTSYCIQGALGGEQLERYRVSRRGGGPAIRNSGDHRHSRRSS
ncbi:hypothetical protein K523DRAFT_102910 [Schizophyllum commune Tattone D]|nr:hypothetical protein K523DRAFT_102910 [Schizophyllum commune Tattone D]